MNEFILRLIFLVAMMAVVGCIGAVFHKGLYWKLQSGTNQSNLISHLSLGLAGIITVTAGMGAVGIRINRASLLIVFGGMLIAAIAILANGIKTRHRWPVSPRINKEYAWLSLLLLVLFTAKLIEIRQLLVPNWVDGLIHVTILEKLVVKGAIPVERIYHSGFHAGAMFVHHILGLSLSDAVLLFGQWISALAGLTFYDFLRRNKIHLSFAFLGAILYGLILLFPSQLVSWGRYPFLLGLALLFPAITSTLGWIEGRRPYLEALIFVCALALSHYGSLLIWFSFLVSQLIFHKQPAARLVPLRAWLLRLSLLILPLLLVLLPKGLNFLGNQTLLASLLSGSDNPDFGEDINFILSLIQKHDLLLFLFCLCVLLGAAALKWRPPARIAAWPILVFILIWAQYTLLGFSITSYTNAIIFTSGPVIILLIHALQRLFVLARHSRFASKLFRASIFRDGLIFVFLVTSIVLGFYSSLGLISPKTTFFTREDSTAMQWIQVHTPQDATFMIQSFIWGNQLMPSDGGGWISILTGRPTVYPSEIGEFRDLADYAAGNDVDYIYLGREYDPNFTLRLSDVDIPYQVVFQSERVMILKLDFP
jgi:hypothetical protein